jgi:hypothetical protein
LAETVAALKKSVERIEDNQRKTEETNMQRFDTITSEFKRNEAVNMQRFDTITSHFTMAFKTHLIPNAGENVSIPVAPAKDKQPIQQDEPLVQTEGLAYQFQENSKGRFQYQENNASESKYQEHRFPKFDGEDPSDWIDTANQYFLVHQIPHNCKILLASIHMEGQALEWFHKMYFLGSFPSWEVLTQELWAKFGPSSFHEAFSGKSSNCEDEANNLQYQEILETLEGVDDQMAARFNDLNQSGIHNDEISDLCPEINSMEFTVLNPVHEQVDGNLDSSSEIEARIFQKPPLVFKNSVFFYGTPTTR